MGACAAFGPEDYRAFVLLPLRLCFDCVNSPAAPSMLDATSRDARREA
jgi:hypothetical protein